MKRGEIWMVDLDRTKGREQAGRRPVLIISAEAFNRLNAPMIVPITSGGVAARFAGLTVHLTGTGTKTQGVVLCNQIRTVDLKVRGGKRIEKAPEPIVDAVLDVVRDILE